MPVYWNQREIDAINGILKDITQHHTGLDTEHLVNIVAIEAQRHGIKPSISAPIARKLIEEDEIYVP
jgi:hypothetical protein